MTTFDPRRISRLKKENYLKSLSEKEFRDSVVRPLLLRQGMRDGRELCGPSEEGKDTIFISTDPLGHTDIYAVQTKVGNLNLASKASENLTTALTQVSTALSTPIHLLKPRAKRYPTKVILCASGKINEAARKHIVNEVKSPHVEFLDADELIERIDEYMSELWYGVDTNKVPYLSELVAALSSDALTSGTRQNSDLDLFSSPVAAGNFVHLRLNRIRLVPKKVKGKIVQEPNFEEFKAVELIKRKEKRILITGEAGSGKSTSLRRIVCMIAESSMRADQNLIIPFLVRAIDIVTSTIPVVEYLGQHGATLSTTNNPPFDFQDLTDGLVTVVVDGLDEIPTHEDRQVAINKLLGFMSTYPECRVVLSSRNYAWLGKLDGIHVFERFNLSPIDWKETTKIIRRIDKTKRLSESKAKELLRRLQEVHGMQLNPLLVTVFVASSEYSRIDVPANITELFKKYTEMMLGRWDANKGFAEQYHAPLKDFLLSLVGVQMHRDRVTSISLTKLKTILTQALSDRGVETPDIGRLLDEIVHRSGLFRVLGEEQVEFSHFLLQEFFAGRGLEEDELPDLISDDWWQRCLVFYFGENPGKHALLEEMTTRLTSFKHIELAQSSLSLGLALQACYLVTVEKKAELFTRVLNGLSRASFEMFGDGTTRDSRPLLDFIFTYLIGRDAVACNVLRTGLDQVKSFVRSLTPSEYAEHIEYWQIVGLLESGCIDEAMDRIQRFEPKDDRLLLTLHMGSYLYLHLRVATKDEKRKAKAICNLLEPKIAHLRKEVLDEFKSQILEIRQGQLKALPDPGIKNISSK